MVSDSRSSVLDVLVIAVEQICFLCGMKHVDDLEDGLAAFSVLVDSFDDDSLHCLGNTGGSL